jgi:cytochrome c oxidase subunit 4
MTTEEKNVRGDWEYRLKKNRDEMRMQVISFALMLFLTLVAFFAVSYDKYSAWFIVPFILLLGVVQVVFQLYYFMHMSHRGHGTAAFFLYSGILVAFLTVLTFLTIVWI